MKYIPLFLLAHLVFSCGKKTTNHDTDPITISIDTVSVDAAGEILYLERGLTYSTLSLDGKYLYNHNNHDNTLEKVDLDELKLVDKLPFEKEGPDGVGSGIFNLQMLDAGKIFISSYPTSGEFSLDGKKTQTRDLNNHGLEGDVLNEYEYLGIHIADPKRPEVLFAVAVNWKEKTYTLRKMDFYEKRITKFDIDPDRKIQKYSLEIPNPEEYTLLNPAIYLTAENGQIIISTDLSNEIYLYKEADDKLISKKSGTFFCQRR